MMGCTCYLRIICKTKNKIDSRKYEKYEIIVICLSKACCHCVLEHKDTAKNVPCKLCHLHVTLMQV